MLAEAIKWFSKFSEQKELTGPFSLFLRIHPASVLSAMGELGLLVGVVYQQFELNRIRREGE